MTERISAAPLAGRSMGGFGSSFVIAEWTVQPSADWVQPIHLHHHDDEAWYVLEGRLLIRLGEVEAEAGPGTAVFAPPAMAHTFRNPGPGVSRYLLVATTAIAQLVEELSALDDSDSAAAIFARHDSELLQP